MLTTPRGNLEVAGKTDHVLPSQRKPLVGDPPLSSCPNAIMWPSPSGTIKSMACGSWLTLSRTCNRVPSHLDVSASKPLSVTSNTWSAYGSYATPPEFKYRSSGQSDGATTRPQP